MENFKIKRLLQKLFENKVHQLDFYDDEMDYVQNEWVKVKYDFKFRMVVGFALGEGSLSVSGINIIIDDIQKEGVDFYNDWRKSLYSNLWYINTLETMIKELFSDLPFSVYLTIYGRDEEIIDYPNS
jgi:hypothetical protein